ncbi:DUF2247 family protein [Chondromyces crocatus]|uniref:DUF2247 domain-containing protein n=1 Tax=Chondromyces crocatus TaxID=52 RepID=A0A0K1EN31_CHOCO|nr:DUF2247 family protein [Chondromyces crocatus]AKT42037.1 uncharacterized protein CMC5_062600 [Chondromyces crocatus]
MPGLDDVMAFATERLTDSMPPPEGAIEFAVASSSYTQEVWRIVRKLSGNEPSNPIKERRKLRLILLQETIAELSEAPVQAQLSLTDFWQGFDFPPDSPHLVQGRGNSMMPTDDDTEATCRRYIEAHEAWVEAKTAALRG